MLLFIATKFYTPLVLDGTGMYGVPQKRGSFQLLQDFIILCLSTVFCPDKMRETCFCSVSPFQAGVWWFVASG